jgi:methyltransferase-like protein
VAAVGATQGSGIAGHRHQLVELDALAAWMIPLMDGSRSRAAMADAMCGAVAGGALALRRDGQRLPSIDARHARDMVDGMVDFLGQQGLLSGANA